MVYKTTVVLCAGLVEYVPRKVCGIRFWYDVRNFSLHGETTILETLPSSCVLARIFSFFFLMGCRPRLKNHEQFVTNQQAPSRNHSEGEKFNKIMHHQTCIQHTYIDKIRGCCKRNMWKLAWVPRMHPETGLTQQFLELKFCHVRALSSYFL